MVKEREKISTILKRGRRRVIISHAQLAGWYDKYTCLRVLALAPWFSVVYGRLSLARSFLRILGRHTFLSSDTPGQEVEVNVDCSILLRALQGLTFKISIVLGRCWKLVLFLARETRRKTSESERLHEENNRYGDCIVRIRGNDIVDS